MEFVQEVCSLEAVEDAFKNNLVVFIKKKYLNLSDLWYYFQNLDISDYGQSKYAVIEKYYGQAAVKEYHEFYQAATYPQYPGVLKVQNKKNAEGVSEGIVPTHDYLQWHRDGPAYRKVYKVICLHAQNPACTSTSFLETVSEYHKLSHSDKEFVDSLVYQYNSSTLQEGIKRSMAKKTALLYPSLLHKEILLNYTDDYSEEPLERPLIRNSLMQIVGFGYDYNTAVTFKDKTFRESLEITKWLKSLLFKDANIYKHQWHNGDVVFFDSVCTQHARDAYQDQTRLLHRMIFNFN